MPRNIIIRINEFSNITSASKKTVLLNGVEVAKFTGNKFTIKNVTEENVKLTLKLWNGFYSTECEIPATQNSCLVEFDYKMDRILRLVFLAVLLLTFIDIFFIKLLPVVVYYVLFYGSLFAWGLIDVIRRKKKFAVTVTEVE